MGVVAGVASGAVEVAAEFGALSVWGVVVAGADGSCVVDEFPDTAEVIAGVVVVPGIGTAYPDFAVGVVAGYCDIGGGDPFFAGLVAAAPEVAVVLCDGSVFLFYDFNPLAVAVVYKLAAMSALDHCCKLVKGVPFIGPKSIGVRKR